MPVHWDDPDDWPFGGDDEASQTDVAARAEWEMFGASEPFQEPDVPMQSPTTPIAVVRPCHLFAVVIRVPLRMVVGVIAVRMWWSHNMPAL